MPLLRFFALGAALCLASPGLAAAAQSWTAARNRALHQAAHAAATDGGAGTGSDAGAVPVQGQDLQLISPQAQAPEASSTGNGSHTAGANQPSGALAGSRPYRMLAVVSTYKEETGWLLAEDNGGDRWREILPTEMYQVADLDSDCQPEFPGMPKQPKPGQITPLPGWPDWAQGYVDAKCKLLELNIRPGSVHDSEHAARVQAGMLQPDRRRRQLLQQEEPAGSADAEATSPERGPTVLMPTLTPLPLHIIPNQGSESMAYLTAILNHYDDLPDLMLFMHGHAKSWHAFAFGTDFALRRLAALPPRNLSSGFMQLGCIELGDHANHVFPRSISANHWSPESLGPRWHESFAAHYMQAWLEPGGLGEIFGEPLPPRYIQAACCASFAVTRGAILRRPRSFYHALRKWLLTTPMERYWAGIVLEFAYHMMFTGMAVYDPPRDVCLCELYDLCT